MGPHAHRCRIKVSNVFIFYLKALRLNLISHNIYSKSNRQMKRGLGYTSVKLNLCFSISSPFPEEVATQFYYMYKESIIISLLSVFKY